MNEYLVNADIIKTKEQKVKKVHNLLIKANDILEAERCAKLRLKNTEGTGAIFIKEIRQRVAVKK